MSSRFQQFKSKGKHVWNVRCPICLDSKTNKSKARGYFYEYKGKLVYHCHNCNVNMDIPGLLKMFDASLFGEYIKEKLSEQITTRNVSNTQSTFDTNIKKPVFAASSESMKGLVKISTLDPSSPFKQYIMNRHIPAECHHKLYIVPKFKAWVNTLLPGKFDDISMDEPRLIIPFLDADKKMFGFQGRSFSPRSKLRYITIMLDDSSPKLFGLDTVNKNKRIYVTEGPIDSLFIDNGIASAGGSIISTLPSLKVPIDRFVVIYDNEPRNKETIDKMEQAISAGYTIYIWPESVSSKDLNQMILDGYSKKDISSIINNNLATGLSAKARLQQWKRK